MFVNIHAPTEKFNLKKLTSTETDDKGKFRKVKISDIEEFLKGGMTEIEKLEAQNRSSTEPEEPMAKESPIEEEETPFKETGQNKGMSFEEIREKVKIRIVELQKVSKSCREMMEKLGVSLKETRMESARLQLLLKVIDQPKGKKDGRKQKSKSK